jgi:hypothetical protein
MLRRREVHIRTCPDSARPKQHANASLRVVRILQSTRKADGVHNAAEVAPGELLKLSSHYKSILIDLVDFVQSCRLDTYLSQLGVGPQSP